MESGSMMKTVRRRMADAPPSPENIIVPQGNRNSNSTNVSIDNAAEGEFEVNLHDLGISLKT